MTIKTICASALLAATMLETAPGALAQTGAVRFENAVQRSERVEMVPVVRRRQRRYRRVVASRGVVVRRRSKKKSAAIVGGSALAGAGIGALAAGGKGAAIGAIAGGGAGYIYDRKTHKKVVREY